MLTHGEMLEEGRAPKDINIIAFSLSPLIHSCLSLSLSLSRKQTNKKAHIKAVHFNSFVVTNFIQTIIRRVIKTFVNEHVTFRILVLTHIIIVIIIMSERVNVKKDRNGEGSKVTPQRINFCTHTLTSNHHLSLIVFSRVWISLN
jgi:hypothetical protein